jgi:hypothetical protein
MRSESDAIRRSDSLSSGAGQARFNAHPTLLQARGIA